MSPLLCVCVYVTHLKRGSRTIGAKNMKKNIQKMRDRE